MSRLGKKPIKVTDKVKAEFKDNSLEVSGPAGKLAIKVPKLLDVKVENGNIMLSQILKSKEASQIQGLMRGIILNAMEGVTKGFKKDLEIHGLGFKALAEGKNLVLNVGFSHVVSFAIPEGIKIAIDKQTLLSVSGIDKNLVGETAARIRHVRPPEPYQGTGIRYAGEHIIRKAGKAAAGAAGGGTAGGKK